MLGWLCLIPGYHSPPPMMRVTGRQPIEADFGEFHRACQEVGVCIRRLTDLKGTVSIGELDRVDSN